MFLFCKKVKKMMSKYLDHQLDTKLTYLLLEHINHCTNCKTEFDLLLQIDKNLQKYIEEVSLNDSFNIKLYDRIFNKNVEPIISSLPWLRYMFRSVVTVTIVSIFIVFFIKFSCIPYRTTLLKEIYEINNFYSAELGLLELVSSLEKINLEYIETLPR